MRTNYGFVKTDIRIRDAKSHIIMEEWCCTGSPATYSPRIILIYLLGVIPVYFLNMENKHL